MKFSSFAAKSVSELISIKVEYSSPTKTLSTPSAATLAAFFSAFNALFDLSKSKAFSISPSHSTSAFLHSIIATPVISLNSFTCDALISIFIFLPLSIHHYQFVLHLQHLLQLNQFAQFDFLPR